MAEWLEQAWLDRYLARQLKPEESDWFEAYILDKEDILARVEDDCLLRDAAHDEFGDVSVTRQTEPSEAAATTTGHSEPAPSDARPRGAPVPIRVATSEADRHARQQPRMRPSALSTVAAAASLLLAVSMGWLGHARVFPPAATSAIDASPTRIVFGSLRGAGAVGRVENPASESRTILVEVSVPYGAENVVLQAPDSAPRPLAVSSDGFASFLIDREQAASRGNAAIVYQLQGERVTMDLDLARSLRKETLEKP
jgi:hypothetical protein